MKKNNLISAMLIFSFLVAFCIFAYTVWAIGKKLNYKFSYQSMVEQTVRDMVKDECLNPKK